MIFEALYGSAEKEELILVENGYLRYHKRLDSNITILEIIVLPMFQGEGIGKDLLKEVINKNKIFKNIMAKCPVDLISNGFWQHLGFILEETIETKTDRSINLWKLRYETYLVSRWK